MMRRWGLIGVAASLLVLLALAIIFPHQMIAPGALIPAHAEITDDCFACHKALAGASPAKCMECHKLDQIGIVTSKGAKIVRPKPKAAFHQMLAEQDCMACHSDHAGPLLTRHADRSFAHDLLKPAVQGQCQTCHQAPATSLHRGVVSGCAQCHTVAGWTPAKFDHGRFFKLEGDHNVACVTCHVNNVYTRYTCFGCHEHQPAQIRALHAEEGIRDIDNCVRCHRSSEGEEGEGRERGGD
jgi:hypothetical protein